MKGVDDVLHDDPLNNPDWLGDWFRELILIIHISPQLINTTAIIINRGEGYTAIILEHGSALISHHDLCYLPR